MKTIQHEEAVRLLRELVKKNGSQTAAARNLDISQAYLADILAGKRLVSDNVARKLGYKRVIIFVKEGIS
jgi:plasmid maintenance system antidote protein VapI